MQEEGRTMSELIREALRLYMDDREWRSLLRYGQRRAREMGISPEDVGATGWRSIGTGNPTAENSKEPQGGKTDE